MRSTIPCKFSGIQRCKLRMAGNLRFERRRRRRCGREIGKDIGVDSGEQSFSACAVPAPVLPTRGKGLRGHNRYLVFAASRLRIRQPCDPVAGVVAPRSSSCSRRRRKGSSADSSDGLCRFRKPFDDHFRIERPQPRQRALRSLLRQPRARSGSGLGLARGRRDDPSAIQRRRCRPEPAECAAAHATNPPHRHRALRGRHEAV